MTRRLTFTPRSWPLSESFVIARGTQLSADVLVAEIREGETVGRGEAVGVPYEGETPATMALQIEAIRGAVETGADRAALLELLPAGGARNLLDAALWDLEAKASGVPAWRRAGLASVSAVPTCITIGIRDVAGYEARARELARCPWLKVKVDSAAPLDAIAAVRRADPDVRLVVDPNQAWSLEQLKSLADGLVALGVDLLEQPVAVEADEGLLGLDYPIPICADEAARGMEDLPRLRGRYSHINIKLDKVGGLTAGLAFARAAKASGMKLMAGCMTGSSLAMAPAMVLAQLCDVADLDGPLLQDGDWPDGMTYRNGVADFPSPELWG